MPSESLRRQRANVRMLPRKRKHTPTAHTYAILMKIPPLNVKAALALARASQSAIATDKYRMPASKSDTCAQVLEIGS